jgi:hypothetical protein
MGLDASPARPGQDGALELWLYPHDADDYLPLLRLPGAPPLKAPRERPPGEMEV